MQNPHANSLSSLSMQFLDGNWCSPNHYGTTSVLFYALYIYQVSFPRGATRAAPLAREATIKKQVGIHWNTIHEGYAFPSAFTLHTRRQHHFCPYLDFLPMRTQTHLFSVFPSFFYHFICTWMCPEGACSLPFLFFSFHTKEIRTAVAPRLLDYPCNCLQSPTHFIYFCLQLSLDLVVVFAIWRVLTFLFSLSDRKQPSLESNVENYLGWLMHNQDTLI